MRKFLFFPQQEQQIENEIVYFLSVLYIYVCVCFVFDGEPDDIYFPENNNTFWYKSEWYHFSNLNCCSILSHCVYQ